jgi:citronellol/citronellal dehydrogenase
MSLKNKVLFISGASRGIGKAIALRAAADGASVAIAAKTATPHAKLAGTIYSAAEEIEKAGGKALPIVCDIRNEDEIQNAVDATVKEFGKLDILVNNASAISLTGTVATDAKKFDLMHGINLRGTYFVTKHCIPHLLKGENPHVLNLSPPLNMSPKWFKNNVAYTMAKYGMSMQVLGQSEEFAGSIAFNALWPKTAIFTAAMEMLAGTEKAMQASRKVEIMSDAAHWILTQPNLLSGNFFVDEMVLRSAGVTDFDHYACVPGNSKFMLDFFLEKEDIAEVKDLKYVDAKKK